MDMAEGRRWEVVQEVEFLGPNLCRTNGERMWCGGFECQRSNRHPHARNAEGQEVVAYLRIFTKSKTTPHL